MVPPVVGLTDNIANTDGLVTGFFFAGKTFLVYPLAEREGSSATTCREHGKNGGGKREVSGPSVAIQ